MEWMVKAIGDSLSNGLNFFHQRVIFGLQWAKPYGTLICQRAIRPHNLKI
jgi:hypothetical protein